jgi:hypothetical protein
LREDFTLAPSYPKSAQAMLDFFAITRAIMSDIRDIDNVDDFVTPDEEEVITLLQKEQEAYEMSAD